MIYEVYVMNNRGVETKCLSPSKSIESIEYCYSRKFAYDTRFPDIIECLQCHHIGIVDPKTRRIVPVTDMVWIVA